MVSLKVAVTPLLARMLPLLPEGTLEESIVMLFGMFTPLPAVGITILVVAEVPGLMVTVAEPNALLVSRSSEPRFNSTLPDRPVLAPESTNVPAVEMEGSSEKPCVPDKDALIVV